MGQDTKFVGGDHVLSSGIKVAWHITAVVALEGLQAHPAKGGFRNVRACEKSGKLCNFAVDHVDIEASGFERGDIETNDVVITPRAISEADVGEQFYSLSRRWRAVLADILGPWRFPNVGATTSVEKEAKVSGLAKTDKCSSAKF